MDQSIVYRDFFLRNSIIKGLKNRSGTMKSFQNLTLIIYNRCWNMFVVLNLFASLNLSVAFIFSNFEAEIYLTLTLFTSCHWMYIDCIKSIDALWPCQCMLLCFKLQSNVVEATEKLNLGRGENVINEAIKQAIKSNVRYFVREIFALKMITVCIRSSVSSKSNPERKWSSIQAWRTFPD